MKKNIYPGIKDILFGGAELMGPALHFMKVVAKNEAPPEINAMQNLDDIEVEKADIIERANWLCDKIIKNPSDILKNSPGFWAATSGRNGRYMLYAC